MRRIFGAALLVCLLGSPALAQAPAKKNLVAEAVLKRLAATPEYVRLETLCASYYRILFDRDEPKVQSILALQKSIEDAARSATVENVEQHGRPCVVFTHDGKKTVLPNVDVPSSAKDAEGHANVAGIVARFILDQAMSSPVYPTLEAELLVVEAEELLEAGRKEAADAVAKKALAVAEGDGPGRSDVGEILWRLGFAYLRASGDDAESRAYMERAVEARERRAAKDPTDKKAELRLAESLTVLAKLHLRRREPRKAPPLYERAIAIYEKRSNDGARRDTISVELTLRELAFHYRVNDQHAEAVAVNRRIVAVAERTNGPDSEWISYRLEHLVEAQQEEITAIYSRSLRNGEHALAKDPKSPRLRKQVAETLTLFAKHLRATNDPDAAAKADARAAQIRKGTFVPSKTLRPSAASTSDLPPPPPKQETQAVSDRGVWVQGHWFRSGDGWDWMFGYLVATEPGKVWVDGRWEKQGDLYIWTDGDWITAE